jgi:hypothetical protein
MVVLRGRVFLKSEVPLYRVSYTGAFSREGGLARTGRKVGHIWGRRG